VNREVEYWLEHQDSDKIIPVVTEGEFTWSEIDIDLESTAAPPALYGAFSDEPRWVDLRFARSEEQLDLNNPRFSAAVADVAAAIRQVPKDELESEEVRQHRRTVRTAWAAGAGLLILALLAGTAALFALDQRNDANSAAAAEADARAEAEANAAAAQAAAEAEALAKEEAQLSASLARSNELALRAEKEIPVDAERAMLLAIEAIGRAREAGAQPVEAARSLRNALTSSRIVHRLPSGIDESFVAVAADGSLLATESESGDGVAIWDTTTWELVGVYAEPGGDAAGTAFSAAGDRLAVSYAQANSESVVSPIVVYRLDGGPKLRLSGDPLPEGGLVAFAADDAAVVGHFYVEEESRWGVGVFSTVTGERMLELEDGAFAIDPAGERLAIVAGFADGHLRIYDTRSGAKLVDVDGSSATNGAAFSPSGTRIAETSQERTRLLIRDAGTGDVLLDAEVDRIAGAAWLDESRVAVGGEGSTRVVDTETGEILFELAGHREVAWNLAAIPGTDFLATAGFDGTTLVWDVSSTGLTELPLWDTGLSNVRFVFDGPEESFVLRHDTAGVQSLWAIADRDSPPELMIDGLATRTPSEDGSLFAFTRTDGTSGVVSIPDGELVYPAPPGFTVLGVNNDRSLVVLMPSEGGGADEQHPIVVETTSGNEIGQLPFQNGYQFSPDSSLVYHYCCEAVSVYVLPGAEPSGSFDGFKTEISDSGAILAYPPNSEGDIWLLDTEMLNTTRDIESSRVAEISAHSGLVFQDFSDDGTMLLTTTFDEPIRIWDITGVLDGREPKLIAEIDAEPRAGPPAAYFHHGDTHIVSVSTGGTLREFTIDVEELIAIAKARLTKTLTPDECARFGIDPCPTLDEIKASTS
jgi:WD40 repeat protein